MAKKALVIGINRYQLAGSDLRGCVNDATNMKAMLTDVFDFPKSGIRTLTDASATKKKIQDGIVDLIGGAKAGDVLVLHYSGHGANVPDEEPFDEADGVDEILCPTDLDWYDPLRDDWLRQEFDKLADGVNFTVIMDCCHSGSNTRELRNPTSHDPLPRYLPSPWALARAESGRNEHAPTRTLGRSRPRRARASSNVTELNKKQIKETLISGCRDNQTSADAWIAGTFQGAMTANLLKAIRAGGAKATYRQIHQDLLKRLRRGGFNQRPQLEGIARNFDRPFLAPL